MQVQVVCVGSGESGGVFGVAVCLVSLPCWVEIVCPTVSACQKVGVPVFGLRLVSKSGFELV